MPRGGPNNTKPTKLHVLHGTDRADRQYPDEPEPDVAPPDLPPGLGYYGKQKWQELAPKLTKVGLLTEIDHDLLRAYCEAYERFRRANRRLHKAYANDEIDPGDMRKIEISAEKAESSLRLLANEFGLSPSARRGLSIEKDDGKLTAEEILDGASRN